jgi:aminoglycoside phosphotransferase (APT) family kinase protein
MTSDRALPPFTEQAARAALADACSGVGLDAAGAALLGPVADNAAFGLPGAAAVARVASSAKALARAERELRVARWLVSQDFPAVRPLAGVDQPVVAGGRVATFWEEIPSPEQASTAELGALLRRLHGLPTPDSFALDPLRPFVRLSDHIEAATGVPDQDRAFLRRRLARLRGAYGRLEFVLPGGVIHGDPHRKNVLRAADGQVVLLDLERFSVGPREWDLAVPAVYRRVGWHSDAEYAGFVRAYGFDVTEWEGFAVLAAIRELRMTAWLAARTGREPRLIPEARTRVASLRDDNAPRRWTPGT